MEFFSTKDLLVFLTIECNLKLFFFRLKNWPKPNYITAIHVNASKSRQNVFPFDDSRMCYVYTSSDSVGITFFEQKSICQSSFQLNHWTYLSMF